MATNFTGSEPEVTPTTGDSPLFAATPVWDRGRKKKGFGARRATPARNEPAATVVAPETRSFTQDAYAAPPLGEQADRPLTDRPMDRHVQRPLDRPVERPIEAATVTPSVLATPMSETEADSPMLAPISRTRSVKARQMSGASPVLIAGGVAAFIAIGAIGWYASRPPSGVPELAPGATEMAAAPAAPMAPMTATPQEMAVNPMPPPAAAPASPSRAPVARTPPAAATAPTADSRAMDASATTALPDGPQPYSALNPGMTPAPVAPPVLIVPPAAEAAPAAIPQTPPIVSPEPPASVTPDPTPTPSPPL